MDSIYGRDYKVVPPMIKHLSDKRKAKARVHVAGLNKADGRPIRFKSIRKAEDHIRTMRLQLD